MVPNANILRKAYWRGRETRREASGAASPANENQTRLGRLVPDLLVAAGCALGYYVSALVGTLLSVPPSGFAIIWPATAFLVSTFLIIAPSRWWLCVAAVIPTHFYIAATLQPGAPIPVVVTQIGGNLILALATVVAVQKAVGARVRFDSFSTLVTFILVAGLGVPAVVNSLILAVHLSTGWTHDFWLAWRQWMIAGIFPTITIPPVLVLAANGRLTGQPSASPSPRLELLLLIALLFAFSFEAFGAAANTTSWPALFLAPFPFLIWAAVRLGVGGTSVSLLVLASATIVQALWHHGPFALQSPARDVISLQAFLVTISIPLILLAALMDERRWTAALLRLSEARMNVVASATDTGLWQWDSGTKSLWASDHCREMFGLGAGDGQTPMSFLASVHPLDRQRFEAAIKLALSSTEQLPAQDFRIGNESEARWLQLQVHSELGSDNKMQVSGVFRDVTERVLAHLEAEELRRRLANLKEDERRRIAEELHDSTAQHLVAAKLNLSSLKTRVRAPETRGILALGLKSLHEALMEVRTFSYLLHPPQLGRIGLSGVLRQYVPGFASRTGVTASLRVNPLADLLSAEQQHAILRITQESLSNVHRHARASNVTVAVRCISDVVHLVVSDDGKGIQFNNGRELGERLRLGVGLPGMAARVQQLGGRMDVDRRVRGTTVHVAIPLAYGSGGQVR
nr:MASE1 domain-containing protein [Sphingomonas alba]